VFVRSLWRNGLPPDRRSVIRWPTTLELLDTFLERPAYMLDVSTHERRYSQGVSKRSTVGLAYYFPRRVLGNECAQPALEFQRSECTCFLAERVCVKRMYA